MLDERPLGTIVSSTPCAPSRGSTRPGPGSRLARRSRSCERVAYGIEADIAPLIDRSRRGARHERREVSRRCVRDILARHLDCRAEDVPLGRSDDARPTVNGMGGPSFSVAHSARAMVLAVGQRAQLGVDVERVWSGARFTELFGRFLSEREARQLVFLPSADRQTAFLRTWVRKEAYLKAVGGGVPAGRCRFSVSVALDEPPAIISTELEDGGASAFSHARMRSYFA